MLADNMLVPEGYDYHECGNCGEKWSFDDLEKDETGEYSIVHDLVERIEAGSIVPSGECPECGALVYPMKKEKGEVK